MPMHPDFVKILKRFQKQYGDEKGKDAFYAWLNKKGYDDSKPFPGKEKRELLCSVRGFEMRESDGEVFIEGLVSTSHPYPIPIYSDIGEIVGWEDFKECVPKETLEAFAEQINTIKDRNVMGLHHSEAKGEIFGRADIERSPAKVIPLSDGEYGLFVSTKLNNEPTAEIIKKEFSDGTLNSFSMTFDATSNEESLDFDVLDGEIVKFLRPTTQFIGYTAASAPVNPNAVAQLATREFRELITLKVSEEKTDPPELEKRETVEAKAMAEGDAEPKKPCSSETPEFREMLDKASEKIITELGKKLDVREKTLVQTDAPAKEVPVEMREFLKAMSETGYDLREQFIRASAVADKLGLFDKDSTRAEQREYKHFATNGRKLEFRGLGITTNQNSDTDYLQAAAELADVYDPVIYRAINMKTVTWNLLQKDNFAGKGNNKVQFKLLTAGNVTAAAYAGDAIVTANSSRLNFETKFKKYAVGISVSGDMIAAAKGGPVGDVFAQEVMDSAAYLLSVMNAALFAEVGVETATGVIGFEYLADSAGNTSLYNLTRSTTNRLAPDSAGDTYINGASAAITMANLRAGVRQAIVNGADRGNLIWITHPIQADMLRAKFDDARRLLTPRDTGFGFSTDLFVDGIPIFEDKDCTSDNWHLVDLETHRIAIWVPPTIEKLGKTADSEDAFVKTYWCTYNRCPRRVAMIYDCATS